MSQEAFVLANTIAQNKIKMTILYTNVCVFWKVFFFNITLLLAASDHRGLVFLAN